MSCGLIQPCALQLWLSRRVGAHVPTYIVIAKVPDAHKYMDSAYQSTFAMIAHVGCRQVA